MSRNTTACTLGVDVGVSVQVPRTTPHRYLYIIVLNKHLGKLRHPMDLWDSGLRSRSRSPGNSIGKLKTKFKVLDLLYILNVPKKTNFIS